MNTIQQRDYQRTDETHRHNFVIAVSSLLDEYGLDPMEYRLYSHIVRRAGKDGCFESIPNMARICLMNEKTVRKALRVLVAAGLIQIAQQRQGKTTIYKVTSSSEWVYSEQLNSIRQRLSATKASQDLTQLGFPPTNSGTTNNDTPTNLGSGSSTNSGRGGGVKLGRGSSTNSGRGVVPDLADEVFPIKEIPIKQSHLKEDPPTPTDLDSESGEILFSNSVTQNEQTEQFNPPPQPVQPVQPTPKSFTSLLNKPESLPQTENPSSGSNMTARSFAKIEQSNKQAPQDPFLNKRQFNSLKGTYKSGATDPWMVSANMPNEEFAKWVFDQRYKNQPLKMLSDAKAEIRNDFVRAGDLWQEFLAQKHPTQPSAEVELSLGYYSNRSLDWHKGTFNELLDLADRVGKESAIAQFTTRYDQQHTGATARANAS